MFADFDYTVNNHTRWLCYFLLDGIYPKWSIFIDTISEAISRKDRHFSAAQESLRKDVERAFGVLVSRWHILRHPCNFWDKKIMVLTIHACIILHNMVVEAHRDGYQSEIFVFAHNAVQNGMFFDEHGAEKPFRWRSRAAFSQASALALSNNAWEERLNARERER